MARKSNGNDFLGILILIFFMIGIPSFLVKEVTKPKGKAPVTSGAKVNLGADGKTRDLSSPVVDDAGVFSVGGKDSLNRFLVNLNDTKGIQIGVLVVSEMDGEDIESFSMRHAERWALGQKGVDNGALLVVSMKEHAVRIETGYGTEGVLTDAKCARILRNVIVPAFKSGNYEGGIIEGVHYMAAIISEDDSMIVSDGVKSEKKGKENSIPFPVLLFIIIWVLMLFTALTSSVRRRRNGIFFVPMGGFGNHHDHWGSGGFGGGSGFGGGGFSGGGGGFGGGGASSSW